MSELDARIRRYYDSVAPIGRDDLALVRKGRRRRAPIMAAATAAVLVAGAVVAVLLAGGAPSTVRVTSPTQTTLYPGSGLRPSRTNTATTVPPVVPGQQPAITSVPGYNQQQAKALLAKCLQASGDHWPHAVLRNDVQDAAGTVLLITTTSEWQTCSMTTNGDMRSSGLGSWAGQDGWGGQPRGEKVAKRSDAPDYYLVAPIQAFSGSGQLLAGLLRFTLIGRAAPDVSEVVWSLPNHRRITAEVHNGTFILDYTERGNEVPRGGGSNGRVSAYNRTVGLIYTAPREPPSVCYATPSGDHLKPEPDDAHCRSAVVW